MKKNIQSVYSKDFSAKSYKDFLSQKEIKLVLTTREIPGWVYDIQNTLNKKEITPLQVWLVKEPVDLLNDRIYENLIKFGFDHQISLNITKDVQNLVNIFVDISGDKTPFVSLRTIDQDYFKEGQKSVSRDWHVDTSVLTLTCTYSGKGTEWTESNDFKIREKFENDKILKDTDFDLTKEEIHAMNLFEVSILKGEIRKLEDVGSKEFLLNFINEDEIVPFNVNEGLLHRGPGYCDGDGRRLLLTVSTMRVPDWLL